MFVEAIIIVSCMILMLLGMVFFRTFYLTQMQASRIARASLIAYSMGGCDDKGGPSAWADKDIRKSAVPTGTVDSETHAAKPLDPAPKPESSANGMLQNIPGAPIGGSALFPVANMGLEMNVQATTSDGPLKPRRGFERTVRSKSYVVCGEEMKDGDIMDLIRFARNLISFDTQPPVPANYVEDPPPELPPEFVAP